MKVINGFSILYEVIVKCDLGQAHGVQKQNWYGGNQGKVNKRRQGELPILRRMKYASYCMYLKLIRQKCPDIVCKDS